MKSALKTLAGLAARTPGLAPAVFGLAGALCPGRFLILTYHRVGDGTNPFFSATPTALFREQMEVLGKHFRVRPLEELVESPTPNAVAITFDDGYRDNYTHAFPILRELGLPATVFLVTDAVDGNRLIWHDRVFDAFHRTKAERVELDGASLSLSSATARYETLLKVLESVRRATPEERERKVTALQEALGVDTRPEGWEKLHWDEVREMHRHGVSFGAHTLDHPILSHVSPEEARRQIRGSKARIESELGCEVTAFAYPNGRRTDFDETTQRILREEGFQSAVTTIPGANDGATDRFALRRVGMWGDDPHLGALRLAWWRWRQS